MSDSLLGHVEVLVGGGKAVASGSDEAIVFLVKRAIEDDLSVSFYLTPEQSRAVREWYWTPERTRFTGIAPISADEERRIRSELGVQVSNFRYAPMTCECGHTYGAYDFLAQGVKRHGLEAVNAVFGLRGATFFQVNPQFVAICPACSRDLSLMKGSGGGWYDCDEYGGCCCCAGLLDRVPLRSPAAAR